jgi:saccharopine dehydrogenase-like protein
LKQRITFGVVGGYGSTGSVVVSELWKSGDGEILIGGRDLAKGNAFAAKFDGRVSAAYVDVLDAGLLGEFCRHCSIIINCASPVMILQDRVAQACFRSRCHYVDAASLMIVKERMIPHSRKIADSGLSFVMSAGWFPGVSEIVPAYAVMRARASMDAIESVTMYFGDSSKWSVNAFQEAAWLLRRLGFSRRGYFRRGEWVRANMREAARKINLGSRIGLCNFYLFSNPELDDIAVQLKDCDFLAYGCVPGLRTALASSLIALLPLPQSLAGRLLGDAFRKNRLPVGGFVVVQVAGRSQRSEVTLTVQVVYEEGREYWVNGLVPATVARMIAEGKGIETGVHYLSTSVDPMAFMAELRKAGVDQSETLETNSQILSGA